MRQTLLAVLIAFVGLAAGPAEKPVDQSLQYLAEARKALVEAKDPKAVERLTKSIDGAESTLKMIAAAANGDSTALMQYIQAKPEGHQRQFAVRGAATVLCTLGKLDTAEIVAFMARGEYGAAWRVAREYQIRGDRAKAVAIMQRAVDANPGVQLDRMLIAGFLQSNDVAGAVEAVASLRGGLRAGMLMQIAEHSKKNGDAAKARELLDQARVEIERPTNYTADDVGTAAMAKQMLVLARAYDDQVVRSQLATKALAAVNGMKEAPRRAQAMREIFLPLCAVDRKQAQELVEPIKQSITAQSGPNTNLLLWEFGMRQGHAGDYAGCKQTMLEADRADALQRCMEESKMPETAEEAKAFIAAFGDQRLNDIDGPRSSRSRMIRVQYLANGVDAARKTMGKQQEDQAVLAGLIARSDSAAAIKELETIQDDGVRCDARLFVASALKAKGELASAVKVVEQGQAIFPVNLGFCKDLANACIDAKMYKEAVSMGSRCNDFDEIYAKLSAAGRDADAEAMLAEGRKFGEGKAGSIRYPSEWTLARAACRRGALDDAAKAFASRGKGSQISGTPQVAGMATSLLGADKVAAWVAGLPDPADRAAGYLAIAKANIAKLDPLREETIRLMSQYVTLPELQ